MNTKSIIATEDTSTAGALVWWRLSGTIDAGALANAWEEAGFDVDALPNLPAPSTAMRRACAEFREKRLITRPLRTKGDGVALVRERDTEDDEELEHHVVAKVRLDAVGRCKVDVLDPAHAALEQRIPALYEAALDQYDTHDVSAWLIRMVEKLGGVRMRQQGGFYFLPHDARASFDATIAVLRSTTSHKFYTIPAMRTEDAVAAVLDALVEETREAQATLTTALSDDELGSSALERRAEMATRAAQKVTRYEALLGVKMTAMLDELETLRASLVAASLVAAAKEAA